MIKVTQELIEKYSIAVLKATNKQQYERFHDIGALLYGKPDYRLHMPFEYYFFQFWNGTDEEYESVKEYFENYYKSNTEKKIDNAEKSDII